MAEGAEKGEALIDIIASLEDQTWKVLSQNGADLLPFLSSDCVMAFPFGMKISAATEPSIKDVMTSEAFLPWKSYALREVVVTPVGSDGAVISYNVKAMRPDPERPNHDAKFRALVSSVWRRTPGEGGGWLMCYHQQTPYDTEIEDLV